MLILEKDCKRGSRLTKITVFVPEASLHFLDNYGVKEDEDVYTNGSKDLESVSKIFQNCVMSSRAMAF